MGAIFSPKEAKKHMRDMTNIPKARRVHEPATDKLHLPDIKDFRNSQRMGAKSVRSKRETVSLLSK